MAIPNHAEARSFSRTLGAVSGSRPGPLLIAVGGVHGNEPSGVAAIQHVLEELTGLSQDEIRGGFVGLSGNLRALAADVRYVDRDLNRIWTTTDSDGHAEVRERDELTAALDTVISSATGPMFALDLHTSSGPSPPFVLPWTGEESRQLASLTHAPIILGFERFLEGLFIGHLSRRGAAAAAFEVGGPAATRATSVHGSALWRSLTGLGIVPGTRQPGRFCDTQDPIPELPPSLRVVHRHPIGEGAEFRMRPGFSTFDRVRRGQPLAEEGGRTIVCPVDGWLLLPHYQNQGDDGFFVAVDEESTL